MFRVITQRRVKKQLEKSGGSFSIRLGTMDIAWNPNPRSYIERQVKPVSGAPFVGPALVTYTRIGDGDEIEVTMKLT